VVDAFDKGNSGTLEDKPLKRLHDNVTSVVVEAGIGLDFTSVHCMNPNIFPTSGPGKNYCPTFPNSVSQSECTPTQNK
jgi:hypothetical protein